MLVENSEVGEYASKFKKHTREEFKVCQLVGVSKRENLGNKGKEEKGRFLKLGVIVAVCENDSYVIKTEDNKLVKKRNYDLKGINRNSLSVDETNRLGEGMLGL